MVLNKYSIKYFIIGYLNVVLNVLINLLLIKFLSINDFGKITIGKSIFQSFETAHLGVRNGLDRLLPHAKKREEASLLFSVAYYLTIASSFFYVLLWVIFKGMDSIVYVLFTCSGFFYSVLILYKVYYRAIDDKEKFVKLSFFIILLPTIIQLIFFYLFGFWGISISILLSYIVVCGIAVIGYGIPLTFSKNHFVSILKMLFSKGFLVYLLSIIGYFSTVGDRFLIEEYWGLDSVGVLGVTMFFFSIFTVFSTYYAEMVMRDIMLNISKVYILKHCFYVSLFVSLFVFFSFLLLPHIVQYVMPQYMQYISLIKVLILGTIPYSIMPIVNYYYQAIDRKGFLFIIYTFVTSLYFVLLAFVLTCKVDMMLLIYLKVIYYLILPLSTLIIAIMLSNSQRKLNI